MKRLIAIFTAVVGATFLCVPDVSAFPGERLAYRAAHFGHKVAHKIDNHVVRPVTHGVKRRLR